MDLAMQHALAQHRPVIHSQWEKLLRLDRGSSPLSRPELVVHLIEGTLDEVFAGLAASSPRRRPTRMPEPECPCGRSPFLAYFAAGRQALQEALILVQADIPGITAEARDDAFACLDQVFSRIARREIEAFCGLCLLRAAPHREDGASHPPPHHPHHPRRAAPASAA